MVRGAAHGHYDHGGVEVSSRCRSESPSVQIQCQGHSVGDSEKTSPPTLGSYGTFGGSSAGSLLHSSPIIISRIEIGDLKVYAIT